MGCTQVVDAFNYASIVPGFFMATIGGINGDPRVLVK
jgi:peptidoglycan biosynthesis protein MviN/MurJ (putative lipid II flippase)